jgi:hypothetical protein
MGGEPLDDQLIPCRAPTETQMKMVLRDRGASGG